MATPARIDNVKTVPVLEAGEITAARIDNVKSIPTLEAGPIISTRIDGPTNSSPSSPLYPNERYGDRSEISVMKSDQIAPVVNKESSDPQIIGMPPHAYASVDGGQPGPKDMLSKLTYATMGVFELTPALPAFGSGGDKAGLKLFSLDTTKGIKQWNDIVEHCGFRTRGNNQFPIQIAYLNDVSIGEQWNNQYDDTIFEGMVNQGSDMLQSLRSITGENSGLNAMAAIAEPFGGKGQQIGARIREANESSKAQLSRIFGNSTGAANAAAQILSGSRVDFPNIWKGSSFEPTYTFTVRLYNPWPNDPQAYVRFILQPLAELLPFVVPYADSEWTYSFPVMCQAKCPGLFYLPSAAITSIRVVKGGDNNDITWHQQAGMVDLQITIESLYQTMVGSSSENSEIDDDSSQRPTLKKYFDSMRDWVDYKVPGYKEDSGAPAVAPLDSVFATTSPQLAQISVYATARIPTEASAASLSLGASVDLGLESGISANAEVMSGISGSVDSLSGGVTAGFDSMTAGMDLSAQNFDISGLGVPSNLTTTSDFGAAGFLNDSNRFYNSSLGYGGFSAGATASVGL
jgi:hypothetical protein